MSKIKLGLLMMTAMFCVNVLNAQSIEDGRKFLYYERFKSAKDVFNKLIASNPNNVEAAYWLGQADIALEDVSGAKDVYQKTLVNNSNSGLLIAGMGHIALLEGNTSDARSRFETAISLSQGKNIAVLNAIGFANVDAKNGDAGYAIEKLTQATQLKGMKDPDVWCNLGDAYRKIGDGGNAQQSYTAALNLNPTYARASYRIGKLYQTQGVEQEDIYMQYFNDAIAKDAKYAPVYYNLYNYYYATNVIKSGEFLEKFIANTDDGPKNCYYRASMKYAQGLFADAITESDKCIATSPEPYPNLYALKAYAYNRLSDSIDAKASFEQYFIKQKAEKIGPNDYITYANILLKFPNNDSLASVYMDKGVAADSVDANKISYIKTIATAFEGKKKFKEAADWYKKLLSIKKNVTRTDIYNCGYNYYKTGNYQPAADAFTIYTQKFPEDAFGYYMTGKALWGIDSTMSQSLANPSFEKAIEVGLKDSVKYQTQLIGSYKYMVAYNANIKKDKAAAIDYCDKILLLDPTDTEAASNKTVLTSMKTASTATKQSAGTKSKSVEPTKKN